MRSQLLLSLGLLTGVAPVWAHYAPPCGYSPDTCLKKVKSCTKECSAFLGATVTPCPVTKTASTTTFITQSPSTTTLTRIVGATDTVSTVVTLTSTTTIDETLTTTTTETDTVTVSTTETQVVQTTLNSVPLKKRDAEPTRPLPTVPEPPSGDIEARGYPTCKPTTQRPSKVPAPASSACHNPSQYSSACACAGVTGSTTTLRPSTTTITQTFTSTVKPTKTATVTVTSHTTVSNVISTTELSTVETTVSTEVVTSTETSSTTETVTQTTTETVLPTCTSYRFLANDGPFAGQFLTGGRPDPNDSDYGFVSFTSESTDAREFTLRSSGRLYDEVNVYGWTSIVQDYYYILQMTDQSQESFARAGVTFLSCSIAPGSSAAIPGAVGTLSCGFEGGSAIRTFGTCPGGGNNLFQLSGPSSSFCNPVTLVAIAAGITSC